MPEGRVKVDPARKVQGYCPMGCGETLFLGDGGYVTCGFVQCPRPDAVSSLLEDAETEHVAEIDDERFTLKHPLRERLDGDLFTCALHEFLAELESRPVGPGRYRVTRKPGEAPVFTEL